MLDKGIIFKGILSEIILDIKNIYKELFDLNKLNLKIKIFITLSIMIGIINQYFILYKLNLINLFNWGQVFSDACIYGILILFPLYIIYIIIAYYTKKFIIIYEFGKEYFKNYLKLIKKNNRFIKLNNDIKEMFLKLKETSNDILELSRDINFKNCIINCKNKKRYSCFLKRRLEIIQLLINNIYFKFINFYFKIKLSYLLYNKIVLSYIISFILIIFIVFYYGNIIFKQINRIFNLENANICYVNLDHALYYDNIQYYNNDKWIIFGKDNNFSAIPTSSILFISKIENEKNCHSNKNF